MEPLIRGFPRPLSLYSCLGISVSASTLVVALPRGLVAAALSWLQLPWPWFFLLCTYPTRNFLIALHSGALHLSEPLSKSRVAGHHYLSDKSDQDLNNGAIITLTKLIKYVMGSAGESEVVALYYNYKSSLPLKTCLEEMGHPQPQMPAVTDNSMAAGLINKTLTPKEQKHMTKDSIGWNAEKRRNNLTWFGRAENLIKHTLASNCPVSLYKVYPFFYVNVDWVACCVVVCLIKFSAFPNQAKLFLGFSAF